MNTSKTELDNNIRRSEEINEHKISEERRSMNRKAYQKDRDHDSAIRTRYGRIIQKLDRMAY